VSATPRRGFASDNASGIHPEVLAAIAAVNHGHAFGYGHDPYTREVEARLAETFGAAGGVFVVFNGSGANVVGLRALCRPWEGVICAATAHLNVDEGGAPEAVGGLKLLSIPTPDGRLTPQLVEPLIARIGDEHAVQPRVLSLTQSTELGTLYSLGEVRELAELAHDHRMLLHMDGARLANAAAALGVGLAECSSGCGVDLLSFGGTKNGLLAGEAIVAMNAELSEPLLYLRKQSLQLASKMRFLAAQFDALLTDSLWLRNARHANAMAARLADAVTPLPGVELTRPVQANAVFAILPAAATQALQERFDFYTWDETTGEVRWMCSWDTTEADVEAFAAALHESVLVTR
jgi:threonine aldolase